MITKMKSLLLMTLAFTLTALASPIEPPAPAPLAPAPGHAHLANLVGHILARYDYRETTLDNEMSARIFDAYLKALDPHKLYFCDTDVELFKEDRSALGNAIYQEDLQIPFRIFNLYQRRLVERFSYARELLKRKFNFNLEETFDFGREKAQWPKAEADLRDIWHKRVKNDWLQLKLAGEHNNSIRRILDKRYSEFLARAYTSRSEDVFQVFMDAYATAVEPHTNYLGLKAAEELDIEMKLSLVGIGAMFQKKDQYLTICELVPGGPAAMSDKLDIGDRLVAVGQGNAGPMIDVVGLRFDDVSTLVRGPAGSVVRLDVLPYNVVQDSKVKHVTLVRGKINFEQDAARKSIVKIEEGAVTRRIGIIFLPTFYLDFDSRRNGEKNFKSAARDVARLLREMQQDNVDGVLVDLRNNGGGSLDEAIKLTGLFIGAGPVVQERNSTGKVIVEGSDEAKPTWRGPLAVLINRGSASASEIFAAAIQDYGRGIIIGERSFGKGTMQTIVNLDQIERNDKPEFGELKITIAQIFRINGDSTQLRGVTPDITFPSSQESEKLVESSFDNALPWAKIDPISYTPTQIMTNLLPELHRRYAQRVANDRYFHAWRRKIDKFRSHRNGYISLNETERRKEHDVDVERFGRPTHNCETEPSNDCASLKLGGSLARETTARNYNEFESDQPNLVDESVADNAQKDIKDVWLREAANILSDEAEILGNQATIPKR